MRRSIPLLILCLSPFLQAAEPEDCAALKEPAARLACFDRFYPSEEPNTTQAPAAAETLAPDPEAAAAAVTSIPETVTASPAPPESRESEPRGVFDAADPVEIRTTVAAVRGNSQQKMVFQLANDQVWMQVSPRLLRIGEGDAVVISSATMGGFVLRSAEGVITRVRRVR